MCCCSGSESAGVPAESTPRAALAVRIPHAAGSCVLECRRRRRASRSAKRCGRPETGRDDRARRPATGRARLVRIAARPDLRRIRGDRARSRQRRALRLYRPGTATIPTAAPGGGGVRGVMKGKVFEKVGVNVSTVGGALQRGIRQHHPRRRGGPALLRHRHQPGRAHGQSARARGAYEHAASWRRPSAGSAAAPTSTRRSPMTRTRPISTRALRAACAAHDPTYYRALQQMGGGLFLHPASRRPARRRRHLLRSSRRADFDAAFRLHPRRRRGVSRHLPELVRRRMASPSPTPTGAASSTGAAAMPSST